MDTDPSQEMNTLYQGGQGRPSYQDFSNPHYGNAPQLPPIQTQRQPYGHPQPQSYNPTQRQQQHPGQGMAYQGYASPGLPQSPYAQNMNQYPHPAYSQGHAQLPIAHDYQNTPSNLPHIRPMPTGAVVGGATGYHVGPDQNFPSRTHVVGSQGRRGILPSDEGRPAAPLATGAGSSAKNAVIPPKDADGKYPCPHCNKTYLHAKHLKRHLLRHTGDRPYSCALCNDTFSRSDILKRHFQKCSIRRGNPTGATHLSNSQSHLRKQQAKKAAAAITTAETGFPTAPHTPTSVTFGENGAGLGMSHISAGNNAQGISSRSDHDRQYDEGRRGLMGGSSLYSRTSNGVASQSGHNSLPSSGSSTPLTARMPNQIPQTFTPDSSTHSRVNSFSQGYPPSNNPNRQSIPQMQGSNMDGGFDWSSFQQPREQPQLPSPVQDAPMRQETEHKSAYQMEQPNDYMGLFS